MWGEWLLQDGRTDVSKERAIVRRMRLSSDEHDALEDLGMIAPDFLVESRAVHLGHPQVAEDQVKGIPADQHEGFAAVRGRLDVMAVAAEHGRDDSEKIRFIVDHENAKTTQWTQPAQTVASTRSRTAPSSSIVKGLNSTGTSCVFNASS